MEGITSVKAIKEYFSTVSQPVTITELKKLSKEERAELGAGAAKELGRTLITTI